MGHELDLSKQMDKKFVSAVNSLGKIIFYRIIRPWCFNSFIFYKFIKKGVLEMKLVEIIFNFTNNIINSRQHNFQKMEDDFIEKATAFNKRKMAMLDLLINAKITSNTIDDDGIKDEVNTFMFEVICYYIYFTFDKNFFLYLLQGRRLQNAPLSDYFF